MSLFKKERFSIRKICGIVGSVLLGSILVAPSIIHASTYHYVEKSALTKEEQSKIQAGIPTDNEASYALIYQQEALPATGSSTSVLTALGLLAVGSLVLLVHKKKKVSSLFLVTTIGLISLSSMQALDISNPLKAPSNEGVVQIAGYRYIGYLPLDDDAISEIQHKAEGTKNVPVSEIQSVHNEASKVEKPEYTAPVGTVPDEAPKAEKPEHTAPVGGSLVEPEIHEKPEYTKPVGTVPDEAPKADKLDYTAPVATVPDEAPKAEKPEYTKPVSTVPDEAPKAEKPEYTDPMGMVPDEAPKAEKPEYTEPVGTVPDEAPKAEKLEYTAPVGGNLVEPEVQPALPEAVVTEKGEPEVQPTLSEAVVTGKGEPEVQPVLPEAVVTEKGEPEVQPALPEAVVTEKGEPEVQAELPEYTTKVAPTLTLDKVTEDAMDRSAKLDYTLENTDNAEIKSIIAEIKDGNTVVKRVDLSKEKLTDAVQGLDLFKDYKISTTMIYNRGEGDETSKLDEKPLRLELKKVEIKNIASTNLVKVNDDGTETPNDFMTEKPSDEDVKKMYLKITSRDNKVTRLAVDKIELVTEKEK